MRTHGKGGTMCEFWKIPTRVGVREEGGGVKGDGGKMNGHHLRLIPGLCLEDRMN